MKTNWTSKEEYLTFVREWKETYATISGIIREIRYCGRAYSSIAATGNENSRFRCADPDALPKRLDAAWSKFRALKSAGGWPVYNPSAAAKWLLGVRAENKVKAAAAREADIAARTVAA